MLVERKNKFKVGDRVFVKIKGFPYWPATVENVDLSTNIPKYNVIFYGDKQTGVNIKETDICLFHENKSRICLQNKRNKKFSTAMKEAELSLSKSSNYSSQVNENSPNVDINKMNKPLAISSPLSASINEQITNISLSDETQNTCNNLKLQEIENISKQLLEYKWVTDDTFQFYFDMMNDKIVNQNTHLLNPSIALATKCFEDITHILEPLKLYNKSNIIIPISDSKEIQNWREIGGTGSHWSVLLFVREQNIFFYFDSLGELNFEHALMTIRKIKPFLNVNGDPQIVKIQTPQQGRNTVDCGIYALLVTDVILAKIINSSKITLTAEILTNSLPSIKKSDILTKRAILALMIHNKQYNSLDANTIKSLMFKESPNTEIQKLKELNELLQVQTYNLKTEIATLSRELDSLRCPDVGNTNNSRIVPNEKSGIYMSSTHANTNKNDEWYLEVETAQYM